MKLTLSRSKPPLAGLLFAEYLRAEKSKCIDIEWGDDTTIEDNTQKINSANNINICRIIATLVDEKEFYGNSPLEMTEVDSWLNFSTGPVSSRKDFVAALEYLNKVLTPLTYLVGKRITIADFAIFSNLYVNKQWKGALSKKEVPTNVLRWYNFIKAMPSVNNTLTNLPEDVKAAITPPTTSRQSLEKSTARAQEGKFVDLPGAEMGKVVVRFPPEASGYLHIGHAKAALLNQYYQQAFNGKLIMRFDDTNPAKEDVHFEQVILEDVKMLEIEPDMFTHTSQYFDLMLSYCEKMLKDGTAYVDDTNPETMKEQRDQRIESVNRNNTSEKNFSMWQEMVKGTEKGQQCCVRAKIDMQSPNGCMRDPTIYRCKNEPHPRTGHQYKVYPTYDFACPIVDAIEGVTHTLRTMEYHDRDAQFYWFIDALGLRKPYIWEYSRLSMTNTVLSKRKLTWFVQEGLVDGWDDPRMPTVRGVLRRGMTVEGLKQFIIAQGSSRSVVFMEWDKIWSFNKKVIDPIAPRFTALDESTVAITVRGVKEEKTTVAKHPKNAGVGNKEVWVGPKILIDSVDAEALKEGENTTFINWGNLMIKKINRKDGKIVSVDAEPNLENKDYKKTLKLTWLAETAQAKFTPTWCVYFDHIISKPLLGKDEDFKQFVGHETRREVKMLGDPELRNLKQGDIIQLQRKGFFRVDVPYKPPSEFTGVEQPVILFYIPDGHTKETPTAAVTASKVQTSNKQQSKQGSPKPVGRSAADVNSDIAKQGDLVRTLKGQKAAKAEIDEAVKVLLALKNEYKQLTNSEWKPGCVPPPEASEIGSGGDDLDAKISAQGEKIRKLKAEKADKATIEPEVKTLLALKAEFKQKTGKDWTPSTSPAPLIAVCPAKPSDESTLLIQIAAQGDKIRDLKSKKADKATIEPEVKSLLALKAEYKQITGKDWTPSATATPSVAICPAKACDESTILIQIAAQGSKIRDLKSKKADKVTIEPEVKSLLALKAEYKQITGKDWTPSTPTPVVCPAMPSSDEATILAQITAQGDKIRELKAKKADKATIEPEVKVLLALKAEYKEKTGKDWTPSATPSPAPTIVVCPATPSDEATMLAEIAAQGEKIRDLKAKKADKATLDAEVKVLLGLKAEFKKATGKDWKPGMFVETPTAGGSDGNSLLVEIAQQGERVRQLKTDKADKAAIDAEVKKLLALKADFKIATGKDWKPGMQPTQTANQDINVSGAGDSSKDVSTSPLNTTIVQVKNVKSQKAKPKPKIVEESSGKKQTRLGLEAKKEENLSDWYSQVITKGEMIEYYDVSGCYIFRPWSFTVWESIQRWFDAEIKKLGVENCYFPIFVSKSVLEKEKTHIADFAPEVAWVTKSGDSDMAEPIAVRPTSETVMYPAYAKWIQSYRDLPIKLNQWNNVVRWEFKHPQPFLRTREFLWQEGHTAYAKLEDAEVEVKVILDLYAQVYTDLLAIPVVKGRKTEKEKFAGGDYTYTVEAFVSASGRAIQGATSHHLGQNFSKMFDIVYEDPETQEKKFVYQNSWGITTRTIGVMIMIHADNQGLVLPPRVASIQIVIVPCGITASQSEADRKDLQASCDELELELKNAGIKVRGDYRDNYSPGWKFNHWELKGVPIRVELGPKDMKNKQLVAVRRDTGEKCVIKRETAVKDLADLLENIQQNLYNKACEDLNSHKVILTNWAEFGPCLDKKNIILAPFCGETPCEDRIKADSARDDSEAETGAPSMGAKSLCIPLEQPAEIKASDRCIHPDCKNKPKFYTLFGRSY